ncbi:hypothetical protein SBA6_120004 [Candidatus Sulfopaludibacter sp. SbA6]|nr:hypothetical protein SBA6_120004 [Candidatus Sulfopaludibacter sp. SbA6]
MHSPSSSENENKALVHYWFEEVWKGREELIEQLLAMPWLRPPVDRSLCSHLYIRSRPFFRAKNSMAWPSNSGALVPPLRPIWRRDAGQAAIAEFARYCWIVNCIVAKAVSARDWHIV